MYRSILFTTILAVQFIVGTSISGARINVPAAAIETSDSMNFVMHLSEDERKKFELLPNFVPIRINFIQPNERESNKAARYFYVLSGSWSNLGKNTSHRLFRSVCQKFLSSETSQPITPSLLEIVIPVQKGADKNMFDAARQYDYKTSRNLIALYNRNVPPDKRVSLDGTYFLVTNVRLASLEHGYNVPNLDLRTRIYPIIKGYSSASLEARNGDILEIVEEFSPHSEEAAERFTGHEMEELENLFSFVKKFRDIEIGDSDPSCNKLLR